jgi:hypothetical protein
MQRSSGGLAAALLGGALLLAAAGASAGGGPARSGLVWVGASQTYGCPVLNHSTKTLTGVIARIRDSEGVVFCQNPCTELLPQDVCDATCTAGGAPGFVYCEASSDQGIKALRATLVNVTTGASSEAR